MASSENLLIFEPWVFRNPFTDSLFSDAIARDNEVLTKALQKSISGASTETGNTSDSVSPLETYLLKNDYAAPTPTGSGLSSSDHESAPKRQKNSLPVANVKVSKRKSRASKKSQTTFITADAANFRQMVQQVTGVNFVDSQLSTAPVLKPEPHRLVSRFPIPPVSGVGSLPTLDTSAFLQNQLVTGPSSASGTGLTITGPGPLAVAPTAGVSDGSSFMWDFDTFPSFPTLESWKVL